ncbi:MAG: hypothetical protein IRY99_03900 [Isosphaeraceae bacterium]|nr:hypothetical protein [Isosphaeraceae bacterium]
MSVGERKVNRARGHVHSRASASGSLKEKYPILFMFGEGPVKFLSDEEARAAQPIERIQSIWPFMVRQAVAFVGTLKPRQRANCDLEDVLMELLTVLLEKDAKWTPERGKYLTFAGTVIQRELSAIRDGTHTIHPPSNSSSRLKEYGEQSQAGTLTARRRATMHSILRVLAERESIEDAEIDVPDPSSAPDDVAMAEILAIYRSAVIEGLRALSPREALSLGEAYGLWGQAETSPRGSKRTVEMAQSKVRERLQSIGHPAVAQVLPD